MKSRLLALLLLFCFSAIAFAQKTYVYMEADPRDAVTRVPLMKNVRISLLDPTDSTEVDTFRRVQIIGYGRELYTFIFDKENVTLPFRRILRVECEGYETAYQNVNILSSDEKHGEAVWEEKIQLHRVLQQTLGEAVVTASKIMMVMKGDTLVYDATMFQLAEGSMLDELIKQLPGVSLEESGRITVNGHFVSSLLINGRDFFNGDPQVALRNLPAYIVKKAKVYQKAPDHAYLTRSPNEKEPRMDDPWVMDVALKPEYAKSYLGNAELAHSVYQSKPFLARLFGMRFSDKSHVALYATGNNINLSGSPQTASGNWTEWMQKEGEHKNAEAGAFYYVDSDNRKIRYSSSLKAGIADHNLTQFTSATSFLPKTDFVYTTQYNEQRSKTVYVNWENDLIFFLPNAYVRYMPDLHYSYTRTHGLSRSAEGNRLLGREGLDSVITTGECGEDFLNLLATQELGRTRQWRTSGNVSTEISLKAWHMNTLSLGAYYEFIRERGYDMQHYSLLTADEAAGRRNRYDNRPTRSYAYRVNADYPIINESGIRYTRKLNFHYQYEQKYNSSERMLYRLDNLGEEWMPDEAPIGLLPSVADWYEHCLDSLNSYRRTNFFRRQNTTIWWYYRYKNFSSRIEIPVYYTYERLNEWRPKDKPSRVRREVYTEPKIKIQFKGLQWSFSMQHKSPSLDLMLDVRDDSDPLSVYLGNPSLKSSYQYNFWSMWNGFQQERIRQWNVQFSLYAIQNAIGQLRQFNPQTGGYTYTPWNINGNRGLQLNGSYSQAVDKEKRWVLSLGTDLRLDRCVDFANTDESMDFHKSSVHNLHISPNAGIDYRYGQWHAGFKASTDWERLTSAREDFETLCQVDWLYTLSLDAPLPFGVALSTDLNLFMRRGYSEPSMNTEEWVWNFNLNRSLDKRKSWVIKLSAHDILGQLSNVRRTLNAQGRVETMSNTLTRYIMLHLIWKFNKKPSKK